MSNPMVRIHNSETGEVIDREMNADELEQYKAEQVAQAKEIAAAQAKAEANATAKAALLARLGITADEAKLLLG